MKTLLCVLVIAGTALAQNVTVTARVELTDAAKDTPQRGAQNVVVWLNPLTDVPPEPKPPAQPLRLVQKNKSFEPHVLVVPVGSIVEFPNHDPFFHNVFSLFEGKRFDLGLYEAGSTRDVHFDRPGISYIFCNIHPQMSAVIVALDTPYYGIPSSRGEIVIPDVPPGRYIMHVFDESALPDALNSMSHEITVSDKNSTLGVLRLAEARIPAAHKNKYGRDYDPPTPDNPAYQRP